MPSVTLKIYASIVYYVQKFGLRTVLLSNFVMQLWKEQINRTTVFESFHISSLHLNKHYKYIVTELSVDWNVLDYLFSWQNSWLFECAADSNVWQCKFAEEIYLPFYSIHIAKSHDVSIGALAKSHRCAADNAMQYTYIYYCCSELLSLFYRVWA